MDKGFRRIALTLLGLTALSVILVGVYLWYNFNSRSNLVLVVPENTDWYIHVQTKEWMKAFQDETKPDPLVKFESKLKAWPIFRGIQSPKEVGVSPHTDWLFFGKSQASFLALSVFSEPALEQFCNRLVDSGFLQPPVKSSLFTRYKIAGKNAYIAFKHKAMVIGLMPDTMENAKQSQVIFNDIFSGKQSRFLENQTLQALYDKGSAVIAWKSEKYPVNSILGQCKQFSFPFNQSLAVQLENKKCTVKGTSKSAEIPGYWGGFRWDADVLTTVVNPDKKSLNTVTIDSMNNGKINTTWFAIKQEVDADEALLNLLESMEITMYRFSQIGHRK